MTDVIIPESKPVETPEVKPETTSTEVKLYAGKYKSVEELEKGYVEAQKYISSKTKATDKVDKPNLKSEVKPDDTKHEDENKPEEQVKPDEVKPEEAPTEEEAKPEDTVEEPVSTMADVISKTSEEFWANGELSEDSFVALEKVGLPRELVKEFAEAQLAKKQLEDIKVQNIINDAVKVVGGHDVYNAMIEYAETLPEAEFDAFYDQLFEGPEKAMLAVRGMHQRFIGELGKDPQLTLRQTVNVSSNGEFTSQYDQNKAIHDPRYGTDAQYTKQVQARMRVF